MSCRLSLKILMSIKGALARTDNFRFEHFSSYFSRLMDFHGFGDTVGFKLRLLCLFCRVSANTPLLCGKFFLLSEYGNNWTAFPIRGCTRMHTKPSHGCMSGYRLSIFVTSTPIFISYYVYFLKCYVRTLAPTPQTILTMFVRLCGDGKYYRRQA